MLQIDIGDQAASQADMVPVTVHPGDSVNVANLAASTATLNVLTAIDNSPTTIAPGANQTFTIPGVWLQSQGRSSVQITGGMYG